MSSPPPRRATRRLDARQLYFIQRGAIILICIIFYFVVFRPAYTYVVSHRDFTTCQDNLRKVSRGIATYASDFDDTLPLGQNWMDATAGFTGTRSGTGQTTSEIFHCPLDTSGAPTSYAYNDLLSGLVRQNPVRQSAEAEARRERAGRIEHAPLIIEKHGGARNAHLMLNNWDDVIANLSRPHEVPLPTGSIMFGDGNVVSRSTEQLDDLRGKRF